MRIHPVFHVSLLRRFVPDPISTRPPPENPPSLVMPDGTEEYEAEEILESRRTPVGCGRRKVLEYKVKWKGYPLSESTWEPADNVTNSPELIAEFYRKNPTAICYGRAALPARSAHWSKFTMPCSLPISHVGTPRLGGGVMSRLRGLPGNPENCIVIGTVR